MNQIGVAEIYRLHDRISITLPEDSPLENLIRLVACELAIGAVFIVNSKHQFVGLVRKSDLLRWAHIKIYGGKGRLEIPVWEFYQIADSQRAGDLVLGSPEISVKENDALQVALDKMLDYRENTLPVVDADKRVVGDLRLSDILSWIQMTGLYMKNRDEVSDK